MPAALDMKLQARGRRYGMTPEQFIVAPLSTLAWRTPVAADMEPWGDWDPERSPAPVSSLARPEDES